MSEKSKQVCTCRKNPVNSCQTSLNMFELVKKNPVNSCQTSLNMFELVERILSIHVTKVKTFLNLSNQTYQFMSDKSKR